MDAMGRRIQSVKVARGSVINIPLRTLNLSDAIWGPESNSFVPERWLDGDKGLPERVRRLPGYRHLMTFMEGPRTCLGRNFAIEEIKVRSLIIFH